MRKHPREHREHPMDMRPVRPLRFFFRVLVFWAAVACAAAFRGPAFEVPLLDPTAVSCSGDGPDGHGSAVPHGPAASDDRKRYKISGIYYTPKRFMRQGSRSPEK